MYGKSHILRGNMKALLSVILILIVCLCYSAIPEANPFKTQQIEITGIFPQEIHDETVLVISNKMLKDNGKSLFAVVSSKISSEYDENMLIDQRRDTCWAYSGNSAWVVVGSVPTLYLLNGLWASNKLYYENNRLREVRYRYYVIYVINNKGSIKYRYFKYADTKVSLPDKLVPISFQLRAVKGMQAFSDRIIKENSKKDITVKRVFYHRLDVVSVYRGTIYNDTCVSYLGDYKFCTDAEYEMYLERFIGRKVDYNKMKRFTR